MERTIIKYKEMSDGKFKIIDFKNVASLKVLENVFGKEVLYGYENSYPNFYMHRDGSLCVHNSPMSGSWEWECFQKSQILDKEKFEGLVFTLKKSGENLQKARRFYSNSIIKTIII